MTRKDIGKKKHSIIEKINAIQAECYELNKFMKQCQRESASMAQGADEEFCGVWIDDVAAASRNAATLNAVVSMLNAAYFEMRDITSLLTSDNMICLED